MASRFQILLDAFTANLNDPTVSCTKGRRALAQGESLPRITHVGLGGNVTDTDLVGEGVIINDDTGSKSRDRIVRVREFNILMAVHGQDEEQAEQLLHNAIAAWESTASGSLSFSDEEWTDQQEGADGANRRGTEIRLTLTIRMPVYATAKPLTNVTSWSEDGMFTTGLLYGTGTYGSGNKYNPGEIVC